MSVYFQKVLDKIAESHGPSHKTKKHPLLSDTADSLVEPDGDLSAFCYVALSNKTGRYENKYSTDSDTTVFYCKGY